MLQSKFIHNILKLLLDGDEEGIQASQQIEFLTESDYDYTGAGVFVGFDHSNGIKKYRSQKEDLILDGVKIESPELEDGAECILFFKKGLIDFLEIWSWSGEYPKKELSKYKLIQVWKNSPNKEIEGP